MRRAALAALLLAPLLGGCDRADVTVGSKYFTEQDILGELVATWIERTTGLEVDRRLHLGGTFLCHRALRSGEIDLYVEYTGTALTAILGMEPRQDPAEVYRRVRDAYRERFDLVWTPPLGFENTFAIVVRRSTADSLGLDAVSDLVPHAPRMTPGMGYEFVEREDGYAGLRSTYDLRFGSGPVTMEIGLLYRALARGEVDVIAGNSTDGQIEALDLQILEDDLRYFPPYEAAPVVRASALREHPPLAASLRRLGGRITTDEMRRMNRLVDVEGRDVRTVAREWVERELGSRAGGRVPQVRRPPAPGGRGGAPRSPPDAPRATAAAGGPIRAPRRSRPR